MSNDDKSEEVQLEFQRLVDSIDLEKLLNELVEDYIDYCNKWHKNRECDLSF